MGSCGVQSSPLALETYIPIRCWPHDKGASLPALVLEITPFSCFLPRTVHLVEGGLPARAALGQRRVERRKEKRRRGERGGRREGGGRGGGRVGGARGRGRREEAAGGRWGSVGVRMSFSPLSWGLPTWLSPNGALPGVTKRWLFWVAA